MVALGQTGERHPWISFVEGVSWAEAEELMRRHQVTGALSPQVRRRLFDEHCEKVSTRKGVA